MTAVLEANFPERVRKVYIVHAPWMFDKVWAIVRPMLTEGTRRKIEVVPSKDVVRVLSTVIDIEYIPDFLGGKHPWPEYNTPHVTVPKGALYSVFGKPKESQNTNAGSGWFSFNGNNAVDTFDGCDDVSPEENQPQNTLEHNHTRTNNNSNSNQTIDGESCSSEFFNPHQTSNDKDNHEHDSTSSSTTQQHHSAASPGPINRRAHAQPPGGENIVVKYSWEYLELKISRSTSLQQGGP
eukprot:c11597_g1_i4.p2 GENE.c11597_g1_i4~~c11597_g1_i4.p2  ORF type:complete len:238 (-),score=70.30 c11597_g1_i4:364-1077(-)